MPEEPKPLVIFFAWQSETLKFANRRSIEASLRAAASQIEHVYEGRDLAVHIDKDTTNRPGSPDIADTILQKIAVCDVFVGDVTIACTDATSGRVSPNANVLMELGYAAGVQGWDRIINVFNKACGHEPEALPFDFRHRRIAMYTLTDAMAKSAKQKVDRNLTAVFIDALTEIVEKNPARPADLHGLSEAKIQERRDIENLTWLLRYVHWPTLDEYMESGPYIRSHAVVDMYEDLESIVQGSSYFHLYDKCLKTKLAALQRAWSKAISHAENYEPSPGAPRYVFTTPVDHPVSRDEAADWEVISNGIAELRPTIDAFLNYTGSISRASTSRR